MASRKRAKTSSRSKKTIFHKILTAEGWRRMLSGKRAKKR